MNMSANTNLEFEAEGANAHMLNEQTELTHADCKGLLEKAHAYWDVPHQNWKSDYLFAHGQNQWDADIEAQRRRARRDCKTYNIVQSFIRPLVNAVKQAPPSITLYPVSPDTQKKDAKIVAGVIRHIEYCSNAQRAYTHALEQIAEGGLGAWRVTPATKKHKTTQYVNVPMETPYGVQMVPSKQTILEDKIELVIEQIDDPTNVYFDPASKMPDFSDANWVIYKNVLSEIDYKRDYPEGKASVEDGKVAVFEYWYFNSNGLVDFVVFDEYDILTHDELELTILPFVLIAGDKIEAEGSISFKSLTNEIKAPQQELNWLKSEAIATISQAPKSSWIMDSNAIAEADEDSWANSASDPDVILRKKPGSEIIPIAPPGPPNGYMDLSSANMEMARQITGIYPDPSTQHALSNASGKAIAYQQAGSQIQTYHFVDALNYGIKRTGEILLDMISVYYNDDDIRVSMGVDNSYGHVSIGPNQVQGVDNLDMSISNYGVLVSSGPTYSTQKEQFSEQLMQFSARNPELAPLIADIVVRYSNIPGSEQLADRFRAMLPPAVQQVIMQDSSDDSARQQMQMMQLQQQLQQAQQQMQMMAQELQQAQQIIQTKEIENRAKVQMNDDKIKADFAKQEADHDQEKRLLEMEGQIKLLLSIVDSEHKGNLANINSLNRMSEKIERLSPA